MIDGETAWNLAHRALHTMDEALLGVQRSDPEKPIPAEQRKALLLALGEGLEAHEAMHVEESLRAKEAKVRRPAHPADEWTIPALESELARLRAEE